MASENLDEHRASAHDATMIAQTRILRASWSKTLRLPKSDFPARPLPATIPKYLRRCTDELYAWQQTTRSKPDENGKLPDTFTLHDGPPYANGPLHIGHALNKITKDIICRSQVAQGKRVNYIPGWDCHGLPIEIKALQAQKKDAANTDAVSVREAARELATRTVDDQMRGFKEWAVMGDWNNAYKTMSKEFEIRQLEVFKEMFEKNLIYRQFKPVYWSPSSRTALAEAELEYDENHTSQAAYVRFPATLSKELEMRLRNKIHGPVSVVVWTTTPWTLPANKAIAVNNGMEYAIIQDPEQGNELSIVATSRVDHYKAILEHDVLVIVDGLRGSDLAGHLHYINPFQRANGPQPVIHADFVTDSSGTGLVHTAPGHGMDDYHVCASLDIPAFAPVDDTGAFTKDAFPEQPELLEGLSVQDEKSTGTQVILAYLEKLDLLRATQAFRHKYPIDWRTKKPVIVRATEQWFANVDGIKHGAMRAIENVNFLPEVGRSRLESFIQGRSQWCISRQRAWGVPIPALYTIIDDKPKAVMDADTIDHIIEVIKVRGIDAWWTDSPEDPAWKPNHLSGDFTRGKDTMDVWFDSGTSWKLLPENAGVPIADVYLEGTDQHRGWFQSSLLTYVATHSSDADEIKAPYKTCITHGFTLDSDGRKMSKSLGNVISPSQIMSGELLPPIKRKKQKGVKDHGKAGVPSYDAMGSDALRLWAASSDYTRDVTIGQPVLLSVNQALHKYRVTFKWILGILSLPNSHPNFGSFGDIRSKLFSDAPSTTLLTDKLALHRLNQASREVHEYYTKYEFFKGVNVINRYINNDLSAFYFETLKDRIYTGAKADCQHLQGVLGVIFYELLQMLAPICPLLVEEAWDFVPERLRKDSIHPARAQWRAPDCTAPDNNSVQHYSDQHNVYLSYINTLGTAIKASQERLRADKKIGSSLECRVLIGMSEGDQPNGDSRLKDFFAGSAPESPTGNAELAGLFVVSNFETRSLAEIDDIVVSLKGQENEWWAIETLRIDNHEVKILVLKPEDHKCVRCWRFVAPAPETLCRRCEDVIRDEEM
ncbi:isoleucyl-tRNA synthetase [Aaosphaeria arxii CBS 175.79]|uniref:Isoleucine--tRNA ligase, mitochondrial n=1 Tax=Aaosphaeria arxii CBS 175.79 TaxID=1450172 RepID=A0A6A5X8Q0_9PLEO|nr:isoleucyl-tRNA synthetase [Aaosphaeria arxii CBS 175.79]KAF2009332.1 isoleucyl-tRNA synthetase [Aaosphaeria arxii CBS 175.79]